MFSTGWLSSECSSMTASPSTCLTPSAPSHPPCPVSPSHVLVAGSPGVKVVFGPSVFDVSTCTTVQSGVRLFGIGILAVTFSVGPLSVCMLILVPEGTLESWSSSLIHSMHIQPEFWIVAF